MSESKLSEPMQALADAIRERRGAADVALCGFDLWLEVLGSGHAKGRDMVRGGTFATGKEAPTDLKVPVMVIGGRVVVSFDPTLPPDGFVLKP